MRGVVLLAMLPGCDVLQDLLPPQPCEDVVDVNAVTGSAELLLDKSDCARDGGVPDRAEYVSLADCHWEPLVDPDANPCGKGGTIALEIDGLTADQLAVDPTGDPSYAEDFVDGVWVEVTYWSRRQSLIGWSTYFRLGQDEDVVHGPDCLADQ